MRLKDFDTTDLRKFKALKKTGLTTHIASALVQNHVSLAQFKRMLALGTAHKFRRINEDTCRKARRILGVKLIDPRPRCRTCKQPLPYT
jgi:hypothetical protein